MTKGDFGQRYGNFPGCRRGSVYGEGRKGKKESREELLTTLGGEILPQEKEFKLLSICHSSWEICCIHIVSHFFLNNKLQKKIFLCFESLLTVLPILFLIDFWCLTINHFDNYPSHLIVKVDKWLLRSVCISNCFKMPTWHMEFIINHVKLINKHA